MAGRGRPGRWLILLSILALLVSIAPIGSAFLASWIAEVQGCSLNEGGASLCMVGGSNWGPTLYNMFVAGWLMLFSIWLLPVAVVLLIVGVVRWVRGRRASLPPEPGT